MHPTQQLDEVIHQRVRLGILAVLREADRSSFGYLKDALDLTDGNLSRHLQVLEGAGMVAIEKSFRSDRPRTLVKATKSGRLAFDEHMKTLQAIIDAANRSTS